ncbi:MAG: MoxR family ATPase, partial [Acidimicrobiales bacterium]|nr:MoxR family ATPase [Acidimicrobiales bacterium]
PLPEAQVDRFALKTIVEYPSRDEEIEILDRQARTKPLDEISPVVELAELVAARALVDKVAIDGRLKEYIVDVAKATRDPKEAGLGDIAHFIQYGCSPRASIWLALASRAHAFLSGRGYVTPGDIKAVALQVLRHRLIPTYEAEAEGLTSDALVKRVLETVPVP